MKRLFSLFLATSMLVDPFMGSAKSHGQGPFPTFSGLFIEQAFAEPVVSQTAAGSSSHIEHPFAGKLVIGMGGIGRFGVNLLDALLKVTQGDSVQVIGLSSDPDKVQTELQKRGRSIDQLDLRRIPSIDLDKYPNDYFAICAEAFQEAGAVLFALPARFHYRAILWALEFSKHVFVEKPMVRTTSEAREVVELAKQKGLLLVAGHNLLYEPHYRRLKEWVDQNKFGRLQEIHMQFLIPKGTPYDPRSTVLQEVGVHDFYMLDDLLGPNAVPKLLEMTWSETGQSADLHFDWSGVDVRMKVSREHTGDPVRLVTVKGDHGTVEYKHLDPCQLVVNGEIIEIEGAERSLVPQFRAFVEAVRTGVAPPLGSAEDAARIVELTENIQAQHPPPVPVAVHHISRDRIIQMFHDSLMEAGVHMTPEDDRAEGVRRCQRLMDHGVMPATNRLDVLERVRANPQYDDKPIGFLLEGQPHLAMEAARLGANALIGSGLNEALIQEVRARYPHVVFIEIVSHENREADQVDAHIEAAVAAGVEGVILKPFFPRTGQSWDERFWETELSIPRLRARFPNLILMPAGGVFPHRIVDVMARLEELTPAVGINPDAPFDEQVTEYDHLRSIGLYRRRFPPAVRWLFVDWTGTLYDPLTRSLIPGSRELLRRIKAEGIQICIVSYGQDEREIIKALPGFGLAGFVDHVRARRPHDNPTAGHKARIIQSELATLNLSPAEAALLGDLPEDMTDADRAGVYKIARIPPGTDQAAFNLESLDLVVSSYADADKVVEFLTELAPMQFNRRGYDAKAAQFAARWGETTKLKGDIRRWMPQFRHMLPLKGGIVDAGSGPGYKAVRLFQDELAEGRRRIVTGVDSSRSMVEESLANYGHIDPDLRFLQGRLDWLPDDIRPNSQAGFWDDGTIHHLPLRVAARTLRSHFDASVPGAALFLLVKKGPEKGRRAHVETNPELNLTRVFYRHDEQSLTKLVTSQGYIVDECRTQARPPELAAQSQTDDEWIYLFAHKPVEAQPPPFRPLSASRGLLGAS